MTAKQLSIHILELVGDIENIDPDQTYTVYFDLNGNPRLENHEQNHTEIKSFYGDTKTLKK